MELDTFSSDIEEAEVSTTSKTAVQKLSCDQCRQRKVRCDRISPCGPCSRKSVQCTYPAGFKPRAKRQRALVSDGYESKLDNLSQKLDRVCLVVDKIESSLTHGYHGSPTVLSDHTAQVTPVSCRSSHATPNDPSDDASRSEPESDTMLTGQATFATNFAQQTVDSHPLQTLPEVKSSLNALREALSSQPSDNEKRVSLEAKLVSPHLAQSGFHLPPMHFAMAAIQKLRETPRLRSFWSIELESVGQFVEYFMTVYSGTPSLADLIIVHCGLHVLFAACGNAETNTGLRNEFESQSKLCRSNLDAILCNLPFNLPSTFDFVLALTMASAYYVNNCRVTLSSKYLAAAIQMSLALGYHRDLAVRPEKMQMRRRRIRIFWILYINDRLFSLRLNRPPSVRDEDITAPVQRYDDPEDFFPISPKWIKMSVLYGKVYDEIYSPRALLQSEAARETRARELAEGLQALFDTRDSYEEAFLRKLCQGGDASLYDITAGAERVSHLSIMTLIYRSIQPGLNASSAFSDECLSTAKQCLEDHKACLSILRNAEFTILEAYVQWTLLSSPFTPFIVLFCHAIETRDSSHLESLAAIVEVLEMFPADMPIAYSKQRRLFKLMYDVACKYVSSLESDASASQTYGLIPDLPFEMLFMEAGMPVPGQTQTHDGLQTFKNLTEQISSPTFHDVEVGEGGEGSKYGAELRAWFDQSHQIYETLQDSL